MKINRIYKLADEWFKRYLILYGGAGSGKSVAVAQKLVKRVVSEENHKFLIIRKVANTLKNSCYDLIKSVIYKDELENDFIFTTHPLEITHKDTGNKFIFLGLDDPEKIKSITDITGEWIEEATELEKEDFTQLDLRLRGETKNYKQIIVSFNPIDEEHWLKSRFFDNSDEQVLTLLTTYKDNTFIDEDYKRTLENLINEDENYYNIYTLGQWGKLNVIGKIYRKFSADNLFDFEYNPDLDLYVCTDFNVDPMKWALIQNVNGNDYIFDEIVQRDTHTELMVNELLKRYDKRSFNFYGDYSGTFRSTSSPTTDYEIIKKMLPGASINIKPNPSVVDRINAVNWRLKNDKDIKRLFVHRNCKHTIKDFERVQWKEGKREIDKSDHELTHISDAIGYYIDYKYPLRPKRQLVTN